MRWFRRGPKKSNDPTEWIRLNLPFFRNLGFYHDRQALTDDVLAREIWDRIKGGVWDAEAMKHLRDLILLRDDEDRIWWRDTEADVCNGNGVYAETLPEWGRISRGAFAPVDIKETWTSEEGPITLAFVHKGARYTLHPKFLDDWIDLGILLDINRIIKPSGYRYYMYSSFDQSAFIVVLAPNEKSKLERERRWKLVEP